MKNEISELLKEMLTRTRNNQAILEEFEEYYYFKRGEELSNKNRIVLYSELKYSKEIERNYIRRGNDVVTVYSLKM